MTDRRILELVELATREGLTLPASPEEIIALEDAGHIVDLVTGEISYNGADNERFTLTVIGEAMAVIEALEDNRDLS